ncbi:MAG: M48 family peptidase [Planctomycetota bacterium]|nr:MAG: M48 family peptidase [Planctomycetota bacterium]
MARKRDKAVFKERVQAWAERLDVRARSITIRPMRTKWASCSSAGRLTFDASLLDLPLDLQDYVIVHELLHFHVPNHGRLWKSVMRAHLGDYESCERRLAEAVDSHALAAQQ